MRIPQRAFCFSDLHARRLRQGGLRGSVDVLRGEYAGGPGVDQPARSDGTVVFAGRLIPEKRADAVVGAVVEAAKGAPELRGVIFGDGPERAAVLAEIGRLGARELVSAPGFVDADVVEQTLGSALCLVLPSRREGYGLIVVEAASLGVPSIVVEGEDNAAVELISVGENGFIARNASASNLAASIRAVLAAGATLRETTAAWYRRNERGLSLEHSFDTVLASYSAGSR
jgi:glycosyltransferase involved in cell wall biosynthesis